jgi:hypothetical protein
VDEGAVEWVAPAPGQLGADGGTVIVSPLSPSMGQCPSCGRRARIRLAFLVLPVCSPFRPVGEGCSRAHATRTIAAKWSSWAHVAAAHTEAASDLRSRPGWTDREERTAAYIEHRGHYAAFLAAAPSDSARRLALQLWSGDPPRLSVTDTATIVAGVLSPPAQPALTNAPRRHLRVQPRGGVASESGLARSPSTTPKAIDVARIPRTVPGRRRAPPASRHPWSPT